MKSSYRAAALCLTIAAAPGATQIQPASGLGQGSVAVQVPVSGRTTAPGTVVAVQTPAPGATASVNTINPGVQVQGAYGGSIPQAPSSFEAIALTMRDAIRRGLEFNLGPVGLSNALRQARGQTRVSRSALLPNISANLRENVQKINLRALGVRAAAFPTIVGPFNYFDLRATLTQTLFDFTLLNNYRASKESVAAAEHLVADARDVVVLAVAGAWLQTATAQARTGVARTQLETARTLLDQATQQNKEGLIATVDVNRTRVQMQMQQQRLITLENDARKQELNLARILGLTAGQKFTLPDSLPFNPTPPATLDDALRFALQSRADLHAAEAQLRVAEKVKAAARAERLPSLSVSADYGVIGTNPAQSAATWTLIGNLRIPVWQGGRVAGDIEQAEAALEQRRAELADVRGRIDQEIRTAFLDLESAASQISVARSNREVAAQSLDLTRQRFEAGVTDTTEVALAQDTLATAELDLITTAFSHNLARVALARAMGRAEENIIRSLGLQ